MENRSNGRGNATFRDAAGLRERTAASARQVFDMSNGDIFKFCLYNWEPNAKLSTTNSRGFTFTRIVNNARGRCDNPRQI